MATVLIADDDQSIRDVLAFALEEEGYTVLTVTDGVMLLECLRATPERLVALIDRSMPRMGGIEVLAAVAAEPTLRERHVYALLTAATSNLSPEEHTVLSSSNALVLAKPFDLDRFLSTVAALARRVEPPTPIGKVDEDEKTPFPVEEGG